MENEVSPESQALTPGSEEYNALMIEKFEQHQGTSEEAPEEKPARPEGLPEKFASWEDMAKAYTELEKKQSSGQSAEEQPNAEQPGEDQARDAVESLGLDFDGFSTEFSDTGELSADSYSKLEAKGISREIVDAYIEGQFALADQFRSVVLADIGEESYAEMSDWAAANLGNDELAAFNDQVESRNPAAAKLAIAGLKAKFDAANGVEPNLLGGDNSGSTDVFASTAEVTRAMRDPRYKKDAAYREAVSQKLARSNVM